VNIGNSFLSHSSPKLIICFIPGIIPNFINKKTNIRIITNIKIPITFLDGYSIIYYKYFMLYLIGLGLHDEKDISLRGLEVAKKCSKLYIENYTSKWEGDLKNIGLKAEKLSRSDLEENVEKILYEAKDKDIGLLIPGDPLTATTHISIIIEAKKQKIKTKIIHSSSIISAICETGLQIYKFGKIVTIPFYYSETPYKILEENLSKGAHTLFLLDIAEEKLMSCGEGLKILLDLENRFKKNLISEDTKVVVFCNAGSSNSVLIYKKIRDLLNFNCSNCVIIIPGKLHFVEREVLDTL